MNDMTPAPISVERLAVSHVKPYGLMYPDPRGEFVRHSDYAALLHQLAELKAEVERLTNLRDGWAKAAHKARDLKEAAERAREEARKELDSAMHEIAGLSPNGYADSYVDRIAAFLAASGGGK